MLYKDILRSNHQGLLVICDKDPHYNLEQVEQIKKENHFLHWANSRGKPFLRKSRNWHIDLNFYFNESDRKNETHNISTFGLTKCLKIRIESLFL